MNNKNVVVYSKDNCKHCMMVKNWLEGNGTEFTEINVLAEGNEKHLQQVEDWGFKGLPVTKINDHQPFDKFQPELLDAYINK